MSIDVLLFPTCPTSDDAVQWWSGPGWYWADELQLLSGPCATEDEAHQAQAAHAFWLNPLPEVMTVAGARRVGLQMRALLLSISPTAREDLQKVALETMEVCMHCGADEQHRERACQCSNEWAVRQLTIQAADGQYYYD